jgi:purine-binding chemotaxis protein CheW
MSESAANLFATFRLGDRLYGVDVAKVQEISNPMTFTRVPLSPPFVKGLINLRGQIATLVDLRKLFDLSDRLESESMFVFCQSNGLLIALQVDQVEDVMETAASDFEPAPEIIPTQLRKLMSGVYKSKSELMSILDIDSILKEFLNGNK